jgi:hypothetical protein
MRAIIFVLVLIGAPFLIPVGYVSATPLFNSTREEMPPYMSCYGISNNTTSTGFLDAMSNDTLNAIMNNTTLTVNQKNTLLCQHSADYLIFTRLNVVNNSSNRPWFNLTLVTGDCVQE